MGSSVLIRRGLTTGGSVFTMTLTSWFVDGATTRFASKVMKTSSERLSFYNQSSVTQSSRISFSTKSNQSGNSPTSSVTKGSPIAFVAWYERQLVRAPIVTKSITGSILWGVGDIVAQIIPQVVFADREENCSAGFLFDYRRTGRAVAFGGFLHAPTSHLHFNFLEKITVHAGFSGLGIPIFKTIMEQFVYWSWISNSMYHAAMGAMQGMSVREIQDRIKEVLWDTQKAQWAFWIPVQLLNFKFVPVRHQLNVVLLTSIVWTALLSMWYPPVEEDSEKLSTLDK